MTSRRPNDQTTASEAAPPDHQAPRRLSPWNPLDHCRLLWWVLVTPQQVVAYREAFGENAECSVSKWLVSTLVHLPVFIVTLAVGLRTLPHTERIFSSTAYMWASVGLALAWVLTGRLMKKKSHIECIRPFFATITVASIVGIFVASSVAIGVSGGTTGNVMVFAMLSVILIITLVVSFAIVAVMTLDLKIMLDLVFSRVGYKRLFWIGVVMVSVGVVIPIILVRGCLEGKVDVTPFIVVVLFVITFIVWKSLRESLEVGRPSWLARGIFVVLVLTYAFLIWFSFLGGWQVFQ